MRSRTKLRLLAIPQLLGCFALLLLCFRFGPRDIAFHYFLLGVLILFFALQLIWWTRRGHSLSNALVREMEFEDKHKSAQARSAEDRLDELERLKRRAMVTPEEYEAKRKDILNDL
jgi:hypothetical protein